MMPPDWGISWNGSAVGLAGYWVDIGEDSSGFARSHGWNVRSGKWAVAASPPTALTACSSGIVSIRFMIRTKC
jgi:hypothetical protein